MTKFWSVTETFIYRRFYTNFFISTFLYRLLLYQLFYTGFFYTDFFIPAIFIPALFSYQLFYIPVYFFADFVTLVFETFPAPIRGDLVIVFFFFFICLWSRISQVEMVLQVAVLWWDVLIDGWWLECSNSITREA